MLLCFNAKMWRVCILSNTRAVAALVAAGEVEQAVNAWSWN
jgi:hypothetical protein